MDVRVFVNANRPDWERLETLLVQGRGGGLISLRTTELRELGLLHRKVSADLAAARTFHAGSKVVGYLNDLALRSHNAVYRAPTRGALRTVVALARTIPAATSAHLGAVAASAAIFLVGVLFGAFGTVLDESVASLVLGGAFVDNIREGRYWIERLFSVVPHSVASAGILRNNLSVAIVVFASGITGVVPAFLLFLNGVMLGAVFVLCAQYGLLSRFLPFVLTHGVIEISAIILAGAGALTIFDSWLHPGDRERLDGLRQGAREGLMVAGAAVPALLLAGPVEGLISPLETVPSALRIVLGFSLGLAYWTWLLAHDRPGSAGAVADSHGGHAE